MVVESHALTEFQSGTVKWEGKIIGELNSRSLFIPGYNMVSFLEYLLNSNRSHPVKSSRL